MIDDVKCEGLAEAGGICPAKKIPTLHEDNRNIWRLITEMLPGLLIPDGGYDYKAIEVVFGIYNIPKANQQSIFTSVLRIIRVIDAERQARREKAGAVK